MKKKLLLIILPMLLFTAMIQAQDHVWDFGNDVTNFPVADAFSDTRIVDGLTFVGGGSSFARVEANAGTWSDGYMSVNRLRSEGSSSVDGVTGLPARRYIQIPVDGAVAVKLWYRFSGTSLPRSVIISDATGSVVTSFESVGDTDRRYIEANYTGGAGSLLVFSKNNAVNYYKLEISSTLLSTNDVVSPVSTNLKAIGNRIYVSNVKASTEINIYSITGALVKSFKTNSNTNFSFNKGLYIATVKTFEGKKSVKLLTY